MLYSLLKSFLNKSSQKSTLFDDLITQSTTAPMNDPTRPGDVDLLLEELRMASEIVEQHRLLPRMVCGSNEPYTITVFFVFHRVLKEKSMI